MFLASIEPLTFEVSLDGLSLPYVYLSGGPEHGMWGVDVSAFAGREVELKLIGYAAADGFGGGALFDSLRFSSTIVVPEPGMWALLDAGGLAMLLTLRQRRSE